MKKIYILVLISFAVLFNGCKEDFFGDNFHTNGG